MARLLAPFACTTQKQSKVGQVVGLTTKKVAVFVWNGKTLVLACPIALSLIVIAQTHLFVLLGGGKWSKADG